MRVWCHMGGVCRFPREKGETVLKGQGNWSGGYPPAPSGQHGAPGGQTSWWALQGRDCCPRCPPRRFGPTKGALCLGPEGGKSKQPGMASLMWVVGHQTLAHDHPPDGFMSNTSILMTLDHEGCSPWLLSPTPVDLKPQIAPNMLISPVFEEKISAKVSWVVDWARGLNF